jgi:hypothetical protein
MQIMQIIQIMQINPVVLLLVIGMVKLSTTIYGIITIILRNGRQNYVQFLILMEHIAKKPIILQLIKNYHPE